ncbi:MAG: ribosomal protein S18-alanine N-acetyltransferase [Bacilli bacterium]|jgi:ribosomal-protein-alanine N-acetyltransferase|nr:ribosomal protein S18-alanine N-acetyltransferase [Bacilli bacterium]
MKPIQIHKSKESELQSIAMLEAACFHDPWPLEQVVYEWKENPVANLYSATIDDEVVGYIDFFITFDSASVARVCVANEYRRNGIAKALIEKMVEVCKKQAEPVENITLEVRESNEAAIELYKKNGFKTITKKKLYYSDGEDAIYMVRCIL